MTANRPDGKFMKAGAIYQINPRTFSEEGTLSAVTRELGFIKELGFGTVYLCPVYREDVSENREWWSERQKVSKTDNPKNPYRIADYFEIDEEYGTIEDLKELADECHRLGMNLMLDLVYRHLGPSADILKAHPEFAKHTPSGGIEYNEYHFPQLNFESEGLREYLYSNAVFLATEVGADAFRCDCTDTVPEDFWAELRRRLKRIDESLMLLNEGTFCKWLLSGFDAMYAFSWHEAVHDVLLGRHTAGRIREKWEWMNGMMPAGGIAMHDIDNHDTVTDWRERTEVTAGHDGTEMLLVVTMLIDGLPMIYCGNELADTTKINMFANRFHKGIFTATDREALKETPAAKRREEIIKALNGLRSESDCLAYGGTEWLPSDENTVAFKRTYETQQITVIACFENTDFETDGFGEMIMSNNAELTGSGLKLRKYGYAVFKKEVRS